MEFGIITTGLNAVAKIFESSYSARDLTNVFKYNATGSLTNLSKLTRVEPLTIISKDCLNLEYLPDINSTLLNMFVAYYLQSINVLTKVKDVEVVRILDRLNPDRDEQIALESISNHQSMVLSNYQHALPTRSVQPALEAEDSTKSLVQDVSNLAVGKLVNVDIAYVLEEEGKSKETKTIKLPINFRLFTSIIPNHSIVSILTHKNQDNSLVERFHAVLSGRISFIRDFIFCQDLIEEWRRAAIEDNTGTIDEIYRRASNAKYHGLFSKNPSLATASNIVVMSKDLASEVEAKLGGKLHSKAIREKAFDSTYAMILVVVDKEWERVMFYIRDQATPIDLSIKEIKSMSKGKGPDIGDILRAFSSGLPAL